MLKNYSPNTKKQWAAALGGVVSTSTMFSHGTTLAQIDFIGNQITAGGGNQLFSDIDFDGDNDFDILNPFYFSGPNSRQGGFYRGTNVIMATSTYGSMYTITGYAELYAGRAGSLDAYGMAVGAQFYSNVIGGVGGAVSGPGAAPSITQGFISATLTSDLLGTHQGFIQVITDSNPTGDAGVQLTRFIYDKDSATTDLADVQALGFDTDADNIIGVTTATSTTIVPEPSSLGLLALGAGGLILRRQRKKAS